MLSYPTKADANPGKKPQEMSPRDHPSFDEVVKRHSDNHETWTYFCSSGGLYYYNKYNRVYREDSTLIHLPKSPRAGIDPYNPDFYIEETAYFIGSMRGLLSRDHNGRLKKVLTWPSEPVQDSGLLNLLIGPANRPGTSSQPPNKIFQAINRDSTGILEGDSEQPATSSTSNDVNTQGPSLDLGLEEEQQPLELDSSDLEHPSPILPRGRYCPHCPERFYTNSEFNGHINNHTQCGLETYTCPYMGCPRCFSDKDTLRRHFPLHRAGSFEQYQGRSRPSPMPYSGFGSFNREEDRESNTRITPRTTYRGLSGSPAPSEPSGFHHPFGTPAQELNPWSSGSPSSSPIRTESPEAPQTRDDRLDEDERLGGGLPRKGLQACRSTYTEAASSSSRARARLIQPRGVWSPSTSPDETHPYNYWAKYAAGSARIDESASFVEELSDVFQGRLIDGAIVAVKCIRPPTNRINQPEKALKRTAHELFVWSLMTHTNVLGLLGFARFHVKLALVTPWMKYKSLLSFIKTNPQTDRCNLCRQVALGLAYVHDRGIIHGDLKGDNVAVSEDGVPKITNFGGSVMRNEFPLAFTATKSLHYSIRWAAPELFLGSLGTEADVYALGMTILETLTGNIPHKDRGDLVVMHAVVVRKELPNRPLQCIPPSSRMGDSLWDLLRCCWSYDPANRPKVEEVRDFDGTDLTVMLKLNQLESGGLEVRGLPAFPATTIDPEADSSIEHSTRSPDEPGLSTPNSFRINAESHNTSAALTGLSLGVTAQTTRVSELIIKRNTDLPTIVKYLVDNGCVDVTSEIENIPDYPVHNGKQSDVYQGQMRGGTTVSVKFLRELTNSERRPNKLLKHTARELYAWSNSSHLHVLELIGLAVVRGKLAMVAPWMEYGSLLAYIDAYPRSNRCILCSQIAEGLTYMHSLGIAHGDVKGDNVVVSKEGVAKITDFGCATMRREFAITFTATESLQYSVRWAAPEMFLEDGATSFETDVYAFGMTILEALSGNVPYVERGDLAVMHTVLIRKELPHRPFDKISPESAKGDELWDLMKRCWGTHPKSRPKMAEIHDFNSTLPNWGSKPDTTQKLKSVTPKDIQSPLGMPLHIPEDNDYWRPRTL